jgi:hypothetical protein
VQQQPEERPLHPDPSGFWSLNDDRSAFVAQVTLSNVYGKHGIEEGLLAGDVMHPSNGWSTNMLCSQ